MDLSTFAAFLTVAAVVVLVPGRTSPLSPRTPSSEAGAAGGPSSVGVAASNMAQGLAAAAGLGALIVRSQPLFQAVKWAGVVYLAYLAVQSLRSAWRGGYGSDGDRGRPGPGFGQGFLSNITNPKVLIFYLAVLPQFMTPTTPAWVAAGLALTHAALSLLYLAGLVAVMDRAGGWLRRSPVRRTLGALTGVALGAFSIRLATED